MNFFLTLLYFLNSDVLYSSTFIPELSDIIIYLCYITIVCLQIPFILKRFYRINLFPLLVYIFCILVVSVLNYDFRLGYLTQCVFFTTCYLVMQSCNPYDFIKQFSRITLVLTYIALLSYTLYYFFPETAFITIKNIVGEEFIGNPLFLMLGSNGGVRITSIFREPGVYALYLCVLAIYIISNYNFEKRKSSINLFVTISALLLTRSTTGLLVFLIIVLLNLEIFYRIVRSNIIFVVALFLLILSNYVGVIDSVDAKISSDGSGYASYESRVASIIVPLKIISQNLTGVGLTRFAELFECISFKEFGVFYLSSADANNTFLNLFAIFGLIPTIFYLYGVYASYFCYSKYVSRISLPLLIILFGCSLDLRFSVLYTLLIVSAFVKKRNYEDTIYNKFPRSFT